MLVIDKHITIRALNPGQAVLDGEYARRVIEVIGSHMVVVLEGLVITKGTGETEGGCLRIDASNVVVALTSCSISLCSATAQFPQSPPSKGGGIFIRGSSVTLTDSSITLNSASMGGGIYVEDIPGSFIGLLSSPQIPAHLHMVSTLMDGNTALSGASSLFWTASGNSLLTNVTFRNHASGTMIKAANNLRWTCHLGKYMPLQGDFSAMDFTSCAFECPAGTVGTLPNLTSALGCDPCPIGHYCDANGLPEGVPCPTGTYMPAVGARSLDSCLPCGAGRFNNLAGQTACTLCPGGFFTQEDKATACTPCWVPGFYAPRGCCHAHAGRTHRSPSCHQ